MSTPPTAEIRLGDAASQERLKRVVSRIYDLPSFPIVINKLTEVAEDPDSSSKDLADVMTSDQGLSAKVLKLVNSAFYSFSTPVSSLQHAITLLGYNTVRSLALSVSVKNMFRDSAGSFPQERFWEHSLATALGAKVFAERNKFLLKDEVFTAGLLHDVGVLLEARYFPEELDQAIALLHKDDKLTLHAAEEQVVGVHHGLLGAWLAEKWRLPGPLRQSILRHHEIEDGYSPIFENLEPEEKQTAAFVTLANIIVRGMGYTLLECPSGEPPKINIPKHLHDYLGDGSLDAVIPEIEERFQQSKDFLTI
ncbi:MAG: HDOD domain-containing protein [Planctomycetota bacterium]